MIMRVTIIIYDHMTLVHVVFMVVVEFVLNNYEISLI
jgi:hypothetical protein